MPSLPLHSEMKRSTVLENMMGSTRQSFVFWNDRQNLFKVALSNAQLTCQWKVRTAATLMSVWCENSRNLIGQSLSQFPHKNVGIRQIYKTLLTAFAFHAFYNVWSWSIHDRTLVLLRWVEWKYPATMTFRMQLWETDLTGLQFIMQLLSVREQDTLVLGSKRTVR